VLSLSRFFSPFSRWSFSPPQGSRLLLPFALSCLGAGGVLTSTGLARADTPPTAQPKAGVAQEKLPQLSAQHSLAGTKERKSFGVFFEKGASPFQRVFFFNREEKNSAAGGHVSLVIPEKAVNLPRRITRLLLEGGQRALWIRYGGDKNFYSVLVLGAPIKKPGEGTSQPQVLLKGWAGVDSKSGTLIRLAKARTGQQIFVENAFRPGACGRKVPGRVRLFDPAQGRFHRVATSPLSKKEREEAKELRSTPFDKEAGDVLLRLEASNARSSLVPVDGDRSVSWNYGHQFVEFRLNDGVQGNFLSLELSQTNAQKEFIWLATESQVYRLTLAESSSTLHNVVLPPLGESDCIALVQPRNPLLVVEVMQRAQTKSGVTTKELIDQLEKSEPGLALSALPVRGNSAALLIAQRYRGLSRLARSRVLDIADKMPGKIAAPIYVAAIEFGNDVERARGLRVLKKLGEEGAAVLAARFAHASRAGEVHLAQGLVEVSPPLAAVTITRRLHVKGRARRAYLREALFQLAHSKAGRVELKKLIETQEGEHSLSKKAQLQLVRALGPVLPNWGTPAEKLVSRLAQNAEFEDAYLLAATVLPLAAGNSDLSDTFSAWVSGKKPKGLQEIPSAALSVHALELLAEVELTKGAPQFNGETRSLLRHKNVRVRRAALDVLVREPGKLSAIELEPLLVDDPWPQVRLRAAAAGGNFAPQSPEARAFASLMSRRLSRDGSSVVRRALARSLAHYGGESVVEELRERMHDDDSFEVRAEATLSLGKLCDRGSLQDITQSAQSLTTAMGDGPIELGLASVSALAYLKPVDLKERIAPLLSDKVSGILRNQVKLRLAAVKSSKDQKGCSAK